VKKYILGINRLYPAPAKKDSGIIICQLLINGHAANEKEKNKSIIMTLVAFEMI
jgi:hypothetical protein